MKKIIYLIPILLFGIGLELCGAVRRPVQQTTRPENPKIFISKKDLQRLLFNYKELEDVFKKAYDNAGKRIDAYQFQQFLNRFRLNHLYPIRRFIIQTKRKNDFFGGAMVNKETVIRILADVITLNFLFPSTLQPVTDLQLTHKFTMANADIMKTLNNALQKSHPLAPLNKPKLSTKLRRQLFHAPPATPGTRHLPYFSQRLSEIRSRFPQPAQEPAAQAQPPLRPPNPRSEYWAEISEGEKRHRMSSERSRLRKGKVWNTMPAMQPTEKPKRLANLTPQEVSNQLFAQAKEITRHRIFFIKLHYNFNAIDEVLRSAVFKLNKKKGKIIEDQLIVLREFMRQVHDKITYAQRMQTWGATIRTQSLANYLVLLDWFQGVVRELAQSRIFDRGDQRWVTTAIQSAIISLYYVLDDLLEEEEEEEGQE